MRRRERSRRELLRTGKDIALGTLAGAFGLAPLSCSSEPSAVVSAVKIRNDKIDFAVERALDLLGGLEALTPGKERILLKPNLVNATVSDTTNREVVRAVAKLMNKAGKEVLIGEGSACARGFNMHGDEVCRTKRREILDAMQQFVFDELGYAELARSLDVALVNLHCGDMARVAVSDAFVFDEVTLHRELTEVDLICSIPMMKTHRLSQVSLGMKNLVGLYPGSVYYSIRRLVHDTASLIDPSGIAPAIVDMMRANPVGLVVIDGSTAMEGQGPFASSGGKLVKTDVVIAGTNALATDMVATFIMGFDPSEIPTFHWAHQAGMRPATLDEIEVRGDTVLRQSFLEPQLVTWASIRDSFGAREI